MTQEEKAKAYDKVREKIALRFGSNVAEEIFSQFEMSEDERIRKALINGFNKLDKSAVWYNGITNGQILAWLEKQGKNNMGISEATKQELENNLHKALEKETPESCNEFLEKQGKQKPADKVEPSIADIVDRHFWETLDYKEQKPVEWSEEDKMMLQYAIEHFERQKRNSIDGGGRRKVMQEFIDWLKDLKGRILPPTKQEWSEKDDRMYNRIVSFIPQHLTAESYTACITWLKSLKERYTWKPSDEQIKALANALSLAKNCGEESAFDLRTLYEQIKKLREE